MSVLLQVILINLIVSFDNIGVIALAARGLSPAKANMARQVGIWLSLILKFIFMLFVGYLFTLTWLHIRIIGGFMLAYVIFGMLRDTNSQKHNLRGDKFIKVILTIAAADISMSLDNVIAVVSIVADESGNITAHGMSIAFLGLAVSVPLLLIASEHIINLMHRYTVLFALCAGYLGYIAANMIFEDPLAESMFAALNFPFTRQLSITAGIMVTALSWRLANKGRQNLQ